jgi:hypothetical protein
MAECKQDELLQCLPLDKLIWYFIYQTCKESTVTLYHKRSHFHRGQLSWLKDFMVFLIPPGKCWDSTLNQTMTTSLYILSDALLIYNSMLQHNTITAIKNVIKNKSQ